MLISSESIMFHLEPGCSRCFGRNIPLPAHPPETLSPYFITGSCTRPALSVVMEWIADFSAVLAKMRMETFCSRFLLFSETLAA